MKYGLGLLLIASLLAPETQAQKSQYDPRDLFPAIPFLPAGNTYRAANGEPGPDYWQNKVDYTIDASLDEKTQSIKSTELITYTNNSPHTLNTLWIQLEQNAFKPHSKGLDTKLFLDSNVIKQNKPFEDGGYKIAAVQTQEGQNLKTDINDTRMQIHLAQPLAPKSKTTIKIEYAYTIPRNFANADFNVNRTDILSTKDGDIYAIAQWYPRLCVFDDVEGWNTLPYLGNGEFYLEYGNFNVNLTVPNGYMIAASGELQNPEEVLTPAQLQRYNQAKNSETKVFIRTEQEVKTGQGSTAVKSKTWKFKIENARDFAWGASKSFIMEGIKINLPSGKKALGISVYPPQSKLARSWDRSSEYVKFTIEYFSKKWFEYPYPCATNVASNLDGMEYPGIVFCSARDTGNIYWEVVNHELGHTWFPMIVGSNERKYAWMDEGFNTFIDNIASKTFNNGEFKGYLVHEPAMTEQLFADSLVPILTRPDGIKGGDVFPIEYLKTAYVLRLLREHILGPDRFDPALKKYINDWAFRHPTPWDFFHSINNTTGEDLTWFWKPMFAENYKLDQAITKVEQPQAATGTAATATIHVDNLEKAAMPLLIEVVTVSGKKERHEFPVEIWQFDHQYIFHPETSERIQSVTIDPDHIFPDVNRSNNKWEK